MSLFIKLYKNQSFSEKLSLQHRVVLSYIIDLSQKEKYCYANNKALADIIGCSEKTVKTAIQKLKEENIIYTTSPNRSRRIYLHAQYRDLLVSEKEAKKKENMKRGKQISAKFKEQKAQIKLLRDTVAEQSREIEKLNAELNIIKAHITLHGIQIGALEHRES